MMNVLDYGDQEEVIRLLAQCMYPDQARILSEYWEYRHNPSRLLLGKVRNNELIGLIGLMKISEHETELKHIAVQTSHRNQGVGREMIEQLRHERLVHRMANKTDERIVHRIVHGTDVMLGHLLIAETDKDAVNFYIKMGFDVTSLGEKYVGVERFRCMLEI